MYAVIFIIFKLDILDKKLLLSQESALNML